MRNCQNNRGRSRLRSPGTNVTDDETSQTFPSLYDECTIVLQLPGDNKFPTIANKWRRLPEGYLLAGYHVNELAMALTVFLGKKIDASKIYGMTEDQLKNRLAVVTNRKVIRFYRKAKAE